MSDLRLRQHKAGIVAVFVAVDHVQSEVSVFLPDPLVAGPGSLEGSVAGKEPVVPGVEAALSGGRLLPGVDLLHPHPVPPGPQVEAWRGGGLEGDGVLAPEPGHHVEDVALQVQPSLAARPAVFKRPVMTGHRLALHLHRLPQELPPVVFAARRHLQARVDVAHHEARVIPVLVGENLGHFQSAAVVSDEEPGLVDRLEGDKSSEEMVISSEPGAFSLETLGVGVALLHPDLAVPVPDVSARPGDRLE